MMEIRLLAPGSWLVTGQYGFGQRTGSIELVCALEQSASAGQCTACRESWSVFGRRVAEAWQ